MMKDQFIVLILKRLFGSWKLIRKPGMKIT